MNSLEQEGSNNTETMLYIPLSHLPLNFDERLSFPMGTVSVPPGYKLKMDESEFEHFETVSTKELH
jgi:hypothetical protein